MRYSVLLQQMLIAFHPDWTDVIVSLPKALISIVSAMMDRCRIQNEWMGWMGWGDGQITEETEG